MIQVEELLVTLYCFLFKARLIWEYRSADDTLMMDVAMANWEHLRWNTSSFVVKIFHLLLNLHTLHAKFLSNTIQGSAELY